MCSTGSIPFFLAQDLDRVHSISAMPASTRPLWMHGGAPLKRHMGYRWIKSVMQEAGIEGAQAMPKGLRHAYGIHALRSGVPLNMVSRWLGHARLETTAIYAEAMGTEELEFADRMWTKE